MNLAKHRKLFARFDETPLAAASIGQAHRAQLPNGLKVVVKVQHADIEEVARLDLEIIRRLTRVISFFFNIRGMDHLYTQVRQMIEEELDFGREAEAMRQMEKTSKPKKICLSRKYMPNIPQPGC